MALTIRGRIYRICPVNSKDYNGKTYVDRDVILNCSTYDQISGEKRDNYPSINFYGNSKCEELDGYQINEAVEITFNLNGRKYNDKTTGLEKYFTKVSGFKIERIGQNQPTQSYPPQDYQPQGMYAQANAPQSVSDFEKEDDDLPF